jgi:MFS-type transporter involved in bile tolerance (Atg22 family)
VSTAVEHPSQSARQREWRGWYFYDWANSAYATTVLAVFLGPYLTSIAATAAGGENRYVDVLGFDVRAKAYYPLVVAVSAIVQAVLMPVAGALADYTGRKKEMLGVLAYTGALATLCFYFVGDGLYLLGGALFLIANVSFAAAMVVYNSFLPEIATPDERDKVSSRGWGFGYLGGGVLLALNLALVLNSASLGLDQAMAARIALASAGLWWGGFTVIPLLRLRNRAAAPAGAHSAGRAIGGSFRQLGRTLAGLRHYPRTLLFLLAYLIYNEGVQTVIIISVTFADTELRLPQTVQVGTILMVQFVAFGGALLLGWIATIYGTKRVVLASLVGWGGVVGAGYFLETGSAAQFFALGFVIAIVLGGTQALSRSMFSHVIPRGREAEYYSLYEISDKGATAFGTAVVTLAIQLTGNYRVAIVSLVVFFAVGFVLLLAVNFPRATREAGNPVPKRI